MSKGTVLITRPEIDSETISKEIQSKGYDTLCIPFLKVIFHQKTLSNLESYGGLIFTSRNGVRSYCQNIKNRDLPIWVVGDATAEMATKEGFLNIHNSKGSLKDLEIILSQVPSGKPLLHVRGQDVSGELKYENMEEETLYHTEKIEQILDIERGMMARSGLSHVLFFSTRTAEAFVDAISTAALKEGLKRTKALCLGDSMVESLSVLPWQSIEVADEPNRQSLLTLLD